LFAKHDVDFLHCEIPSCEGPECESGNAELDCNVRANKITVIVSVNNCKVRDENMVISGRITFVGECKEYNIPGTSVLLPHISVTFENTKIEIYQENQKIHEYEFSPKLSISSTMSASSQNDTINFSSSLNLSGDSREKDFKQNIEQKVKIDNFIGTFNSSLNENTAEFSFSFSGRYSVRTSPEWCGDGGFEVSTIEPLKFSSEQGNDVILCPTQGKLKINNSELSFVGNNVKISVDGQEKTLNCSEFLNSCPYPLKGPLQAISEE